MERIAWLLLFCSFQLQTTRDRDLAWQSALMQSVACVGRLLQTAPDALAFSTPQSSRAETLASVLRTHGLQTNGQPLPNMEKKAITPIAFSTTAAHLSDESAIDRIIESTQQVARRSLARD